jgi:CDP-diacylglycerol--glycerol-3-phosphate 3-phosphatidyltransferase
MRWLPNLLTGLRLVLALFVFAALLAVAGAVPGWRPDLAVAAILIRLALAAFIVAAVTDFFDGWLARRFNAASVWGAILDPIADKVLVCATLVGLLAGGGVALTLPAGLILMREFAVSGLREVVSARGLKLPVTWLAKWKTTIQLVALAALIVLFGWPAFGLPLTWALPWAEAAFGLLWLAAAITVLTGAQYFAQAARALRTTV